MRRTSSALSSPCSWGTSWAGAGAAADLTHASEEAVGLVETGRLHDSGDDAAGHLGNDRFVAEVAAVLAGGLTGDLIQARVGPVRAVQVIDGDDAGPGV